MRILQLNCVYKEGSTGKIVERLAQSLRKSGHDVLACYGIGAPYYDNYSKKICSIFEHKCNAFFSRLRGIPYGGFYLSNARFVRILKSYKPDVVHVHCINANTINVYSLLKYLARNRIRTILTLHAEIFYTAGCEHACDCDKFKTQCHECEIYKSKIGSYIWERSRRSWNIMNETFKLFDSNYLTITAVSPWLAKRAKQSSILKNFDIKYVPNGIDTNIFSLKELSYIIDREHYSKVILFSTAYFSLEEDDLKGGRFVPMLAEMMPDYKFIVVASRYVQDLRNLPPNVVIWGKAKNQQELAQLYSEADATILLSRRESFSMVTVESLCCGTPVVGFVAGGPESIALKKYSKFVDYGDLTMFNEQLREMSNISNDERLRISMEARTQYSGTMMAKKYSELYDAIC